LVPGSKKSFWSHRRRFRVQKKVFGVVAAGSAFKKKFLKQSGPVERSKKKNLDCQRCATPSKQISGGMTGAGTCAF